MIGTKILKSSKGLPAGDLTADLMGRKLAETRTKETEISGPLPLTFSAREPQTLKNYRIFGTAAGAGVQTINLLDVDARDTANGYVADAYLSTDGAEHPAASHYAISEYIPVSPSTQYSISSRKVSGISLCFYDASKEYISGVSYTYARPRRFTSPSNAAYLRMTIIDALGGRDMLLAGYYDEEPAYEPFGYKIPLTLTSGQNANDYAAYIGNSQLSSTEYIDFGEQKVYKDVSGVLTPVDPPAPLPAIIAYKGENTLDSTETVGEVMVKGRIGESI